MSTEQRWRFPDKLVLPFTTLYKDQQSSNIVTQQIEQGNTFSVAFDMTHVSHTSYDGIVFMATDSESNFKANTKVQLSNEGIYLKLAFASINDTPAEIFGSEHRVNFVFLVGTHVNGKDVFTWETGMRIDGSVVVTNGAVSETMISLLEGRKVG